MKTTNIDKVRYVSKQLLRLVPVDPVKGFEFIVQHPFTNSPVSMSRDGRMLDLTNRKDYEEWIDIIEELIDRVSVEHILYHMINTPWNLTWLDFVKEYLSEKDFAVFLGYAWVSQENPNMDVNVDNGEAIKWFKKVNKKHLMNKEDYEYWKSLPEKVTLYRGVGRGRKELGLSWTENKEKAEWFRDRWGNEEGKLLKVIADKKYCLCYFNSRGEHEIVLDVQAVKDLVQEI